MGRCSDARERLLCHAARLLHERGYTAVSVADICAAADLKKGSFYHFFPSKRDLVLAVVEEFGAQQHAKMMSTVDPKRSVRDQLTELFHATATQLRESFEDSGVIRGCPLGNLALEVGDREPEIEPSFRRSSSTGASRSNRCFAWGSSAVR